MAEELKPTSKGNGTTAAVALIIEKKLWVANVGDSRVVLCRLFVVVVVVVVVVGGGGGGGGVEWCGVIVVSFLFLFSFLSLSLLSLISFLQREILYNRSSRKRKQKKRRRKTKRKRSQTKTKRSWRKTTNGEKRKKLFKVIMC